RLAQRTLVPLPDPAIAYACLSAPAQFGFLTDDYLAVKRRHNSTIEINRLQTKCKLLGGAFCTCDRCVPNAVNIF
ncbi:hypothetical protein, partial [Bradyrhizobium sp. 18]|uniref:hypothetical protein n=1 Tax=Bradyrhizobium sp. 18 TaxID=2782657 RepID=UPI001FF98E53